MRAQEILHIDALPDALGREWTSNWLPITQEHIDRFADLSGDRQWIHVDAERARRDSPYGSTIAHGFFTLALLTRLLKDAVAMEGAGMAINYGLNRVRFPAPLLVGRPVRGRFTLQDVDQVHGGVQVVWNGVVEAELSDKPCCAAEWVVRYTR